MSKMATTVKNQQNTEPKNAVTNFMGGTSYTLDPLDTLKIVSASSIMGEPAYYRDGTFAKSGLQMTHAHKDGRAFIDQTVSDYVVLNEELFAGETTSELMERVIDEALAFDFGATLNWAVTLRKDFYMRLNPQVIMVRAASHPARAAFTEANPGKFSDINQLVMSRADEPAAQLTYYLFKNKNSMRGIPGLLKRSWAAKMESLTARDIYKYAHNGSGVGMIPVVHACHPHSQAIDALVHGTISDEITDDEQTWERMHMEGKSWKEILSTIKLGHMALLRNLRNIFKEVDDLELCKKLMIQLKAGVLKGKQFPFRYKTAMESIEETEGIHHKQVILDTLEECMDIACNNMPKLPGRTCCLSDNSGSAWNTFASEYGKVTVATIGNLSSVITAHNSEEGFVGVFGDRLTMVPVSHREGVLKQTQNVDERGREWQIGWATENGIWLFFDQALRNKEHWDNIVIYSDQQAGHGGLYGINPSQYTRFQCGNSSHIDVAKLIDEYRRKVNPRVNVFSVQTAGYDNVLVPENGYRTSILYGWTGKELLYMDVINRFWDDYDERHSGN